MKTILIPTDFSEIAHNAMDYAVEIAKLTESKLILFHAYHVPPAIADEFIAVLTMEELEKSNVLRLENLRKEIQNRNHCSLDIECICRMGLAVDEIREFVKTGNVDLIIMGIRGTYYISERLIGSTTTTLIKEGGCPVLVINRNVKFKNIQNIVFACDYNKIEDESILNPLKEFVGLFKSHVYVFNVKREMETVPAADTANEEVFLEHSFEGAGLSFHYAEEVVEDVTGSVNTFAGNIKADMIVMIPHKHTLLENILHESNTKRMAFHVDIPLLALHRG